METKPWYTSKTIWGALVVVASQIAHLFGKQLPIDPEFVDSITTLATVAGGALTAYGRVSATATIGSTPE